MTSEEIKIAKVARVKCQKSLMFFTRYFFVKRQKRKFVVSNHHELIIHTLERVAKGELTRVIFNIAPRYGKTEIAVKNFIAWCLANNPRAKFIHLSYSDDLALDNSEEIRELIQTDEFTQLFPEISLKKDSKSKKKWYTNESGGVYATSASGQVTGFGAGRVDEEKELINSIDDIDNSTSFGGAIIIDDPIKPDDVYSVLREKVNNKFDTTIRNRVNSRNTPIIIIMQRLHPEDLCGYLAKVEPGVWTVVSLPVIKEDGTALWPFKHTIEELTELKRVNEHVFETQYMQNPQPRSGLIIKNWRVGPFNNDLPFGFGLDFGSKDPDAMVRMAFDKPNNRIYVKEEIYQNGLSTDQLADVIKTRAKETDLIVADNAAKRTILDLRRSGLNVRPCIKDTLTERIKNMVGYDIVVDPLSVNLIRELGGWVWVDKVGEIPSATDNHAIDAFFYIAKILTLNRPLTS